MEGATDNGENLARGTREHDATGKVSAMASPGFPLVSETRHAWL
jgi:hypothetical protein